MPLFSLNRRISHGGFDAAGILEPKPCILQLVRSNYVRILLFSKTIDALKNIGDKDYYSELLKVKLMKAKEKVSDQHALRFLLKFHTIITAYALNLQSRVSNNAILAFPATPLSNCPD